VEGFAVEKELAVDGELCDFDGCRGVAVEVGEEGGGGEVGGVAVEEDVERAVGEDDAVAVEERGLATLRVTLAGAEERVPSEAVNWNTSLPPMDGE